METSIVYGLLIAFSFLGCTKEDDLSISNLDRNRYAIADDPSDELTHLRYTIYKETGISILYNDTLGSDIRCNWRGESYTHYAMIQLGYTLTSNIPSPTKYSLEKDRENVRAMVELLNEYTIPLLTPKTRPMCFFVVDTLTELIDPYAVRSAAFRDPAATCIGWAEQVKGMTVEEKKRLGVELAGVEMIKYLLTIPNEVKEYEDWVKVTEPKTDFGRFIYKAPYDSKAYGFEHFVVVSGADSRTPTQAMDMRFFIGLIYCKTDAEIREIYKDWPKMIGKYESMKKLMKKHGFLK